MKFRALIAAILAMCLFLSLLAGCHSNPSTPESSATGDNPSDVVIDPNSDADPYESSDTPSDEPSDPVSDEPTDPVSDEPDRRKDTSDTDTPKKEEKPHTDPADKPDVYPDKPAEDPKTDDGRDWTQPTVALTDIPASRLAELKKKYAEQNIPAYTETYDASTAAATFSAAQPQTVRMAAATAGGTVTVKNMNGKTGWEMTAGANDTIYLDLDNTAAAAYAGGRVSMSVEFYAPRSTTVLALTHAGGTASIRPAATKIWKRIMVLLENARFDGSVNGHDLQLSVTGGSAVIGKIVVRKLDAAYQEVSSVTLVKPQYGNDRAPLTVNATVQQFGAVGDGKADDTAAFQLAVNYVGSLGGGTVFVPAGHYALADRLTIPANVLLTGELDVAQLRKTGKVVGTVLDLYAGKNEANGEAAITISNGASVQYMAMWYPEQKITEDGAMPYAYTLAGSYATGGVSYGLDIENVVLVNSYNGMRFGPKYNVLETIRNVWGTPLNTGFLMDANADLARIEGIYFSPSYWANSGLANAPEQDWVFQHTFNKAIAYIAERVDWTYIFDLKIDGYQTGVLFRFSTGNGGGSSNGSLYNLDIADCFYGVDIAYMNEIGIEIAASKIYSSGTGDAAAIRVHSGAPSTLQLVDCELGARGKHVIYSYKDDVISLSNCTLSFLTNVPHGAALYSYKGAVSASFMKTRHVVTDVYLGKNVGSAAFVNCNAPVLNDLSTGKVARVDEDESVVLKKAPAIHLDQAANYRPSGDTLVDLTGKIAAGEDAASKIQSALDSLRDKGGIVYLPAGQFTLNTPITIPEGVELRGAVDVPVYNTSMATLFVTKYGKGDENAKALITMKAKSGLVGISVIHEQNSAAPVAYPYVICGDGSDIYVRNTSMNSCYNGIDFATNRCDRHLVQSFSGVVLNQGIVVGGGSQNGVIRDVLVNPVYWGGSGSYNDAISYAMKAADGIVIGNSTGELLYSTFYYAAEKGLVFRDGCKDAVSVTHGTDCANIGMCVEGACGEISLVNYQVASWTGSDATYARTAEDFTGTLNIHGLLGWGGPNIGLDIRGGKLYARQVKMVRYGSMAVDLHAADAVLIGMHLYQTRAVATPLTPNLILNENAKSLLLVASVFDNEPLLHDFSDGVLCGPDAVLF